MLKQTISYEDLNGNEVSEDFYFNFNRLEIIEMELKYEGGIEGHVDKLKQTSDAREAFHLFKNVVLESYGEKSADAKQFIKTPEIRQRLEFSPALEALLFEFLEDPAKGAKFIEGILPPKVVQAAREQMEREKAAQKEVGEVLDMAMTPPDRKIMEDVPVAPKDEISDEELLKMRPQDMTREQLTRAFQLKTQA